MVYGSLFFSLSFCIIVLFLVIWVVVVMVVSFDSSHCSRTDYDVLCEMACVEFACWSSCRIVHALMCNETFHQYFYLCVVTWNCLVSFHTHSWTRFTCQCARLGGGGQVITTDSDESQCYCSYCHCSYCHCSYFIIIVVIIIIILLLLLLLLSLLLLLFVMIKTSVPWRQRQYYFYYNRNNITNFYPAFVLIKLLWIVLNTTNMSLSVWE